MLAGPTGVGKSELAVLLAERVGAEIVCADAFQAYRGLGILTAQPGPELAARVPHHLYGSVSASESLDAAAFAQRVRAVMAGVAARGRAVLLVGGSGLYLRAILGGLDPLPPVDPVLRASLVGVPLPELLRRLREADPGALEGLDLRNPRRVQRALEIVLQTGRPLVAARTQRDPIPHGGWILVRPREVLYQRIAANIARMFERGVVAEVRGLGEAGPTASRAIGWKEVRAVGDGRLGEEAARRQMVAATRAYARRQMTWFRNQTDYPPVSWDEGGEPGEIAENLAARIGVLS